MGAGEVGGESVRAVGGAPGARDGEGEAEGGKVTSVVVGLAVWIDGRA